MKFSRFYREFIVPPGLFASLVIGAGMFSLPYLFSKAGILTGFGYLLTFGLVFSIIHLMYAEVLAKTKGEHAFLGYARIHLGQFGFLTSIMTTVVGNALVLLIYLVLSASFLKVIAPSFTGDGALLAFWLIATIPIILGIKRIANLSLFFTIAMILIIVWVFVRGAGALSFDQILAIDQSNLLLPYGAILFSLAGRSAIGPIRQYLKDDRSWSARIKPAVVIGTLAAGFFYMLFALGIIGLSNQSVSMDAISGITGAHPIIRLGLAVLGVLSIWTSYIFIGMELKNNLKFDLKLRGALSAAAVAIIPPLFYFLGFNNFINLIGFSGEILLAIESILVVLMWRRLESQSRLRRAAPVLIIGVFVTAIVHQLWTLLSP